jgi:hypothetical protein
MRVFEDSHRIPSELEEHGMVTAGAPALAGAASGTRTLGIDASEMTNCSTYPRRWFGLGFKCFGLKKSKNEKGN